MQILEKILNPAEANKKNTMRALEEGKILYLPKHPFACLEEEKLFFSPKIMDPRSKNVSFAIQTDKVRGVHKEFESHPLLAAMLKRYALEAKCLFETLFPRYTSHVRQGRTSFRPCETEGRCLSRRKDDTLLHIDAFAANPVKGERILRIFSNVNPFGRPRVWNVGESFAAVIEKFLPQISAPLPLSSSFLKLLKITKEKRTLYDYYMLNIHNKMKEDASYQASTEKHEIQFPAQSTWIVYSDLVSHAALFGQFLFEQTFYLPVYLLQEEEKSPLRLLEKKLKRKLT